MKSQEEFVTWVKKMFGATLDRSTFSKILKNKDIVLVEQATYIAHRIKVLPETKHMTRGWIMSFKKRHDIRQRGVWGEAGTVDPNVINLALPELTATRMFILNKQLVKLILIFLHDNARHSTSNVVCDKLDEFE